MNRLIIPVIIFAALHCLVPSSFAQDTDSQIKYDTDPSFIGDGVYNLTGDNQTITHTSNNNEVIIYNVRVQNDTLSLNPKFILEGTSGGAGWDVKYYKVTGGTGEITSSVVAGTYSTDAVIFGEWFEIRIEVTPDAAVAGGSVKEVTLKATSTGSGADGSQDLVKAVSICAMNYRSDGWIKRSYELDSAYVGDGIYNTNALSQTVSQNVNSTITLTYHIKIENDGNTDQVLTVTGTGSGGGWTISYYDAVTPGTGADITDMLVLTGWSLALTKPTVTPTNEVFFRAEVTAGLSVSAGATRDFYIVVTSITDTAKVDTVRISSTCVKGATLTLNYGSKNPAVSNEFTNVAKLAMLQFTVSVPSANEDVNINSLILIASGTADDKNAISGVRVINDANKNGLYDAGETLLGGPAVFSADDATLNLTISPPVILSIGNSQTWLIVYQLSGSGTNGKTIQVTLSGVNASGRYSLGTITPGGLPLPSSTKTIDDFTVSTTTGLAPLEVTFGGLFGTGGSILKYDWDFDYNGVSFRADYSSAQSTNATYAYDIPGSYAAVLRITYYDGSTIDRIVYFDIQSAPDAPVIYAIGTSVAPPIGSPPFAISFTANITATNGVKAYLWDFDGDGLIDYCSATLAGANHTYRKAGTYGARLILQDTAGHLTAAQQLVTVNPPASAYPTAQITTPVSPTTITVCDNLVFTGTGTAGGGGTIDKYEWDLDGDGIFDIGNDTATTVRYTYTKPGVYNARLRVTEGLTGLIGDTTCTVTVSPSPTPKIALIQPGRYQAGKDALREPTYGPITIKATVSPIQSVQRIDFRHNELIDVNVLTPTLISPDDDPKPINDPKWYEDFIVSPTLTAAEMFDEEFVTVFNMQRLATLDWYEMVAVANLEVPAYTYSDWNAGQLQKRVFIQKNAGSPELKVNNSSITQTAKVYREITYQVTKYPEATVLVPYQGVTFDGNLIVERNTDNIPASTLSNLYQFVAYENIWLDGIGLLKPFRVKMAYPDVDNDGIIDGTSELAESSLRIYNYSTTRSRWEPIFGQVVDRQNNLVSGWTADLGVFAVVGKYPDVPVITGQSARLKMDKGWAFCAIATAAYGTPFAKDINVLRNFRDRCLLTNPLGRKYVVLYYKYSPPVAAFIRQYPVLRYLTRQALQPIIATLKP